MSGGSEVGGAGAVVKRRVCTHTKEVAATPLQLQLCQPARPRVQIFRHFKKSQKSGYCDINQFLNVGN